MEHTLIDTSSWIEALRRDGDPVVRDRVKVLLIDCRAAFCDLVLVELWNGARGEHERSRLSELEENLPSLELNAEVWDVARENARFCRSNGLTIPATDLIIASCSLFYRVDIEHCDAHIERFLNLMRSTE